MAPCETHCDTVSFAAPQILKHPWMKQTQRNKHLANAMQNLRQFNARRKLRVSVNGLVISVGCTGSPTSVVYLYVAQAAALACVVGGRLGTRSSLASLVGETNCTRIAVQHNMPLSDTHMFPATQSTLASCGDYERHSFASVVVERRIYHSSTR